MADKVKIFIVEDDPSISRLLQLTLEREGFDTTTEFNGRRACERILQGKYDLILLDVTLPEMNGMEICERIREVSDVPIIMLTSRAEIRDKVEGLDRGADDYMIKPFAAPELLARIRGKLRRRNERLVEEASYVVKNMILSTEHYEVTVNGEFIELTRTEYELLKYLVKNKNKVLSRDQIIQAVWDYDYTGDTNVVDVYVRGLRKKIDERFDEKYIYTIRGVGYIIKD